MLEGSRSLLLTLVGIPERYVTSLTCGIDVTSRFDHRGGVLAIDGFQGVLRRTLEYLRETREQRALLSDIPLDLCRVQLTESWLCSRGRGVTSG